MIKSVNKNRTTLVIEQTYADAVEAAAMGNEAELTKVVNELPKAEMFYTSKTYKNVGDAKKAVSKLEVTESETLTGVIYQECSGEYAVIYFYS